MDSSAVPAVRAFTFQRGLPLTDAAVGVPAQTDWFVTDAPRSTAPYALPLLILQLTACPAAGFACGLRTMLAFPQPSGPVCCGAHLLDYDYRLPRTAGWILITQRLQGSVG